MPSVILTRSDDENRRCAPHFEAHRLRVFSAPMIELRRREPAPEELAPLRDRGEIPAVLLTSAFATRLWLRLHTEELDGVTVRGYYLVGEQSAALLREKEPQVPVRGVADSAEGLLREHIGRGEFVLYPCSAMRREEIVSGLADRGVTVVELPLYEPARPEKSHIVLKQASAEAARPLAICFYSPSAVENFFSLPTDFLSDGIFFAAIGETTAGALHRHGVERIILPDAPDTAALAGAVAGELHGGRSS